MKTVIDWSLDRETFRETIKRMTEERARSGKVIPLPTGRFGYLKVESYW